MKKIFVFACAVALTMGFGCALTNYSLITDNALAGPGNPVNTNGKAFINFTSQIAVAAPDGQDVFWYMLDQAANGDRVIQNYNYFTTTGSDPFLDNQYCSPDRHGCSMITAQDPEVGDVTIFDYTYNINCTGLRSITYLGSVSRYYGSECGRARTTDRVLNALNLANQMDAVQVNGRTWLHGNLSALNTSFIVEKGGSAYSLPITGQLGVYLDPLARRLQIDATNPLVSMMNKNMANFDKSHNGGAITGTLTVNGVSVPLPAFALSKNAGRVK
jgi:hypothetical protein